METDTNIALKLTGWSSPQRRMWMVHVIFFLLLAGGVLILFLLLDPHTTLHNAGIATWYTFFAGSCLLLIAVALLLGGAISLVLFLDKSPNRRIQLTSYHWVASYLVTSLFLFGWYPLCFRMNLFASRESDGTVRKLDSAEAWWVPRLLIVNVFLAGLL